MPIASGTRLGPYEISGPLGAGGMGEVYRARDTTLKREVAIKVLPEAMALDANRLARFQREAQLLASLNHPNIAAIYGVEQVQGSQALVLELVDGPTLADRLDKRTALAVEDALNIARQIADALEAAHGQSIVHRDLKPANIKLRPDGVVKVLDFGLARGFDDTPGSQASSLSLSPTLTASPMTGIGMILGTAAYMSPEQARGRTVDKRADIWAFGCVLYEMLTGRPVFDGSDVSDVMASVIKSEVRWDALPAQTPASIRRLLQRCLQKDPKLRLRDIGDARLDLDDAVAHPESADPVPAARHRKARRVLLVRAAALAVTLLAGAAAWWLRPASPASPLWFTVLPQQAPALTMYPTVAPDGRQIAFVALNDAGRPQLWLRTLDNPSVRPLPGTEGANEPFWSPDSRSLAFFAESKLKRLDLDATSPQILADVPQWRGRGNWGPDGTIYFSTPFSGIWKRTIDGTVSELTTLGPGDTEHSSPFVLPDGRSFLYTIRNAGEGKTGIYTRALEGGEPTLILPVYSRAEFFNGHLIYGREIGLYKQAYDFKTRKLSGEPIRLAEKVGASGGNLSLYAFASSSTVIVYWEDSFLALSQLTVFDRSGRTLETIGQPGEHIGLALSPDEQYFALERRDPKTNIMDVWLQEASAAQASRFTTTTSPWRWSGAPRWMPSSDRILFTDFSDGYWIKTIPGRGPAATDRLSHQLAGGGSWPQDISSDGKWLVTSVNEPKTGYDIWRLSTDGTGKPEKYLGDRYHERQPRLARGGAMVAYVLDETGRNEVYVDSFPTPGNRRMVSAGGGTLPLWRKDGRELYYIAASGDLTMVEVSTAATTIQSSPPRALFRAPRVPQLDGLRDVYAALGQGERFVFAALLPNQPSPGVTVAMNWRER